MMADRIPVTVDRNARDPLHEQIHQHCRAHLMAGRLVPGQKLSLRPLAREFHTSLMPVRDALNALVAQGALEMSDNRVYRVPEMSNERVLELHETRRALEGLATELATPNLSIVALNRLGRIIHEMRNAYNASDIETCVSRHYGFHFTVYMAANRPNLCRIIESLWLQLGPWFRQSLESYSRDQGDAKVMPESAHEELVLALGARDAVAARAAIERDIDPVIKFVQEQTALR